jgi:hypothetical protein
MATTLPGSANAAPIFLVDGVNAIAIHNGVARIQFMRLNLEGKPETMVELAVPVPQVKSIVEAFMKASRT